MKVPDNGDGALLGPGGLTFVACYLIGLLALGVAGRRARQQDSLSDFYLGGRSLGLFVLFLTLYATQYSGLTFVGFVGKAYRTGFHFLVPITFTISIIAAYFIIAPRLSRLSRERGYITLGDFVQDRFCSTPLTVVTTLIGVFALACYILANLKAIGYVVEQATGGQVSVTMAIVSLSLWMVVYESLGGMRAVAWTDVVQGILLLAGCLCVFVAIASHYGGPVVIGETLMRQRPDFWAPPSFEAKCGWLSTIVLVSSAVSIYPHAVQRIYSAASPRVLKRSLQLMIVMPFVTMLPMICIGFVGVAHFPDLSTEQSEKVLFIILNDLFKQHAVLQALLVLLVAAIIAAIMSTVDSALLAISSLVTQDFYRRLAPDSPQELLTRVGKAFSWLLMALLAYLAIHLSDTLWRLTEVKLEVLCQVAPVVFLGLHWRRLDAHWALAGVLTGIVVTVVCSRGPELLSAFGHDVSVDATKPWGVHGGIWGLAANTLVAVGGTLLFVRSTARRVA